jgi:short subunit dehydrogenase-like uncharacterized protein
MAGLAVLTHRHLDHHEQRHTSDPESARSLARRAGTIATTVGPYRRLGLPLAQACTEAETYYADLTGEVLFIRDTIASCQQTAISTGAITYSGVAGAYMDLQVP